MFYFIFKQKGLLKNSFAVEYQPKHKITFTDVGGQNMAKRIDEALDFILMLKISASLVSALERDPADRASGYGKNYAGQSCCQLY